MEFALLIPIVALLIPIVAILSGPLKRWIELRENAARHATDDLATRDDTARLQAEVRALKQRVATLERIATDGAHALDREIEALRDRP